MASITEAGINQPDERPGSDAGAFSFVEAGDPEEILNWQRLDARITTSGQPSEAGLARIAALGVTHIVNLGLHDHERALPDEAGSVAALGMTYVHLPVRFDAPAEEDYRRFAAVVEATAPAPIHVHCILNARVSAFFYRWRRERLGWAEAEARAALHRIWRSGGAWAAFIGDEGAIDAPHLYRGKDY